MDWIAPENALGMSLDWPNLDSMTIHELTIVARITGSSTRVTHHVLGARMELEGGARLLSQLD